MLKVEVGQPQGLSLWGLPHLPVGRAVGAGEHDLVVIADLVNNLDADAGRGGVGSEHFHFTMLKEYIGGLPC